jgi:hypothetical protein
MATDSLSEQGFGHVEKRDMRQCSPLLRVQRRLDAANLRIETAFPVLAKKMGAWALAKPDPRRADDRSQDRARGLCRGAHDQPGMGARQR